MNIQLAESISNYFDISNGNDTARVTSCFTPDATVYDEGGTYQGLAAIESWLQETRQNINSALNHSVLSQKSSKKSWWLKSAAISLAAQYN